MDNFNLGELNYWAILVALVFNQLAGALLYTIVSKPWMTEVGLTTQDMEAMRGTPRQWYPFVIATISSFVWILVLALFAQGLEADTFGEGLGLGLMASIGFILTMNAANYSFEGRSLKLYIINHLYPLISYSVIGVLLAVWS